MKRINTTTSCRRFGARLAAFALGLAGGMPCGAAPARLAAPPPTWYVYHGERQDLRLDTSRVAIFLRADAPASKVEAAVQAAGAAAAALEPTGVAGWRLVRWRDRLVGTADCAGRLSALLETPGIEFASPVFAACDGGWILVTPEILLQVEPGSEAAAAELLREIAPQARLVEADLGGLPGAYRLRGPERDGFAVLALADRLAQDPRLAWAEPDMQFTGHESRIPNDPGFASLWGIRNTGQFGGVPGIDMDGDLAWDITLGSPQVKVLVIDTGVQQDHPDLAPGGGADFTGQSGGGGPVSVCENHGTAVAGCISARIDNGLGTVGIAPLCSVLSARFAVATPACDGGWTSQSSWTVNALAWGYVRGARVSNNSNGYGFSSNAIDAAYASTRRGGMVHFAAAGNSASADIGYPASLPTVNAVAALAPDGNLASFSNFGPKIAFCAPGTEIYTTDRTGSSGYVPGDYILASGTSFASPYAAGVAALLLAQDPGRSAATVEDLLRRGCRDLGAPGFDTVFGWGLVNAYESLRLEPPAVARQRLDSAAAEPRTALAANRPNPFTDRTALQFDLAAVGRARLCVYDAAGRRVRRLLDGELAAGRHERTWDGRDDLGRPVPAGVYFYRLQAAGGTRTRRMLRLGAGSE